MKEETAQLETKKTTEQLILQRTKVAEEERRKTVQYEQEMGKR